MTQDLTFLAAARRFTRRGFGASVLAAALVACGGGGGGGDDAGPALAAPPTTAAALAQSDTEARAAVQALGRSTAVLVQKRSTLDAGALFSPFAASNSPLNLRNIVSRSLREQALASETVTCANLQLTNCSGSVTFDSNVEGDPDMLPAGSYVTMTFNALSGSSGGSPVTLNGSFRLEFLTSLNLTTFNLANVRFQITLSNFSGTAEGISFGPETAVALYEFDAQSVLTVTIDGLRFQGGVTVTDAQNYSVSPGALLRTAHWGNAAGYIEVDYTSWQVSQGRPVAGSSATITGTNGSVTIVVQSSSASLVTYQASVTVDGATTAYVVSADLTTTPPTWTVQLSPT